MAHLSKLGKEQRPVANGKRLLQHLSGPRGSSILHKKLAQRLDRRRRIAATREDVKRYLGTCSVAWKVDVNPEALKARLMDQLAPELNQIRPTGY